MKNIFRLFAVIAFVAIIGFSFIACGGDDPDPKPDPNPPPANVSVTGVSMEKTATTILVGSTETLYATVTPNNATNKTVAWSTSNANVATVANGVVTAKAAGTATITVTTADGNRTAACTVTVSATAVAVTGVSLNKSSTSITIGGTETLIATITPSGATNQNVNWVSSNTAIATVNGGTVTAHAAGSTAITVTTVDGSKTATCSVTVTAITYYIKYDANGGSGTAMANSTHTYDVAKNLSSNTYTPPTDKQFGGWNTAANGSGTRYTNTQSVKNLASTQGATVTLYAQWLAVSADQDFYYGVVPVATLNFLKGTNAAAENGWKNALGLPGAPGVPTANSHAHLDTINASYSVSAPKSVSFSGNNFWFIMVPKSLGNAIIISANQDVTALNAKDSASWNGVEYWLHASTSGGSRDGLTLEIAY